MFFFSMGDTGKKISILKVDIEGHEFKSAPQWLESDILATIDQIHLEVHVYKDLENDLDQDGENFLFAIWDMFSWHGFKIIHYEPNLIHTDRTLPGNGRIYTHFDIVLYKP